MSVRYSVVIYNRGEYHAVTAEAMFMCEKNQEKQLYLLSRVQQHRGKQG
jgi:hypothetical protein